MKAALRIPCKDEGTQKVKLLTAGTYESPKVITRSPIFHTLQLLHNAKQLELFSDILMCNDGSTDDTAACIDQFIKKYHYKNITLYGDQNNLGKGRRFIEGMDLAHKKGCELLVATDADMIRPGDMLPGLIQKIYKYQKYIHHIIGPVIETENIRSLRAGATHHEHEKTSGTRVTKVKERHTLYHYMKKEIDDLFSKGNYILEASLNILFSGHLTYINRHYDEYQKAAAFLPAFRGGKSTDLEQRQQVELACKYLVGCSNDDIEDELKINFIYNAQQAKPSRREPAPKGKLVGRKYIHRFYG